MSPLAPQRSEELYHIDQDSVTQQNLLNVARILNAVAQPKITYSLGDLHRMRHTKSKSPNLSNRILLASISRIHVAPTLNDNSSFSTRIMSSAMMYRDQCRPSQQRLQTQINGRHMNSGFNIERNRFLSRGKWAWRAQHVFEVM